MDAKPTGDKKRDDIVRAFSKDVYETFFKGTSMDEGYVDAGVRDFHVRAGIEPGYMYNPLKIIEIHEKKEHSRLITGYSWEAWGSGLRLTKRYYMDYKYKSKFVKFVDKWHSKLFQAVQ